MPVVKTMEVEVFDVEEVKDFKTCDKIVWKDKTRMVDKMTTEYVPCDINVRVTLPYIEVDRKECEDRQRFMSPSRINVNQEMDIKGQKLVKKDVCKQVEEKYKEKCVEKSRECEKRLVCKPVVKTIEVETFDVEWEEEEVTQCFTSKHSVPVVAPSLRVSSGSCWRPSKRSATLSLWFEPVQIF